MKRRILSFVLAVTVLASMFPMGAMAADADTIPSGANDGNVATAAADSIFDGGDGTAEKPYLISTAEQLDAVRNNTGACYKMTADIDLSGAAWTPFDFSGTFDGNGHRVTGLNISATGGNLGFFMSNHGTIQNFSVYGSITVTGGSGAVGGIVAVNSGTVRNCYNAADVTGYYHVGGIAGGNSSAGGALIENCYNLGNISRTGGDSSKTVGGIAGYNNQTVRNCYNLGTVDSRVGGRAGSIVGQNGTTSNCYYLTGTYSTGVGFNSKSGVTEKSAEEFKTLAASLGDAWATSPYLDHPVLKSNPEAFYVAGGEEDPSIIPTLTVLEQFRDYVNDGNNVSGKYFKLANDIDMSATYGEGKGPTNFGVATDKSWTPIGVYPVNASGLKPFAGTFDGCGHEIRGLYINDNTGFYSGYVPQGLFSYNTGTIQNLMVSGSVTSNVNGYAGGIVGMNNGTVKCCINNASVTANFNVGGIAGYNDAGTVENCINNGTVKDMAGSYNYGGIGGISGNGGTVKNSYNIGDVSTTVGAPNVGGVAGSGRTENSYYLADTDDGKGGKTAGQLASGEVTKLLGDAFGQRIGVDENPVLLAFVENPDDYKVFSVTFQNGNETVATKYANMNGTVEPADLGLKGFQTGKWVTGDGTEFSSTTPVTADILVTAEIRMGLEGEGTSENPYLIPDQAALELFRSYIGDGNNGAGKYFKVTANIALNGTWTAIGAFAGVFDGDGHLISNLNGSQGLFSSNSGTIKNVGVSGTISVNSSPVGGIVGRNDSSGIVQNCYNAASVTARREVGGIVGTNSGTVLNCYNTGTVTVTNDATQMPPAGGIVGANTGGTIRYCYNTGSVTATNGSSRRGGMTGQNGSGGKIENCYYLRGVSNGGVTFGGGATNVVEKTADQFASGEVAWLLQNGQDDQIWGQSLGSDSSPILTTDSAKRVLKVTFVTNTNANYSVVYTNPDRSVALPDVPSVGSGYLFYGWSTDGKTPDFTADTPVTSDTTVYALRREKFGGENGSLNGIYGYTDPMTLDLDGCMGYQNGTAAAGKFNYTIANNGGISGAFISGSILTIPTGLNAGTYTLTVIVEEIIPAVSPLSIGSYDTSNVTLTVTVVIGKADLTADMFIFTAPEDLIYDGNGKAAAVAAKPGFTGMGSDITVQYYDETGKPVDVPAEPGRYTVKIRVSAGENYNAADLEIGTFTVKYLDVPEGAYTVTGTYTDGNGVVWIKEGMSATITPKDGYTIATSPDGEYKDSLSVSEWTSGDKIYIKDAQGHMSGAIAVTETVRVDSTAPAGEIEIESRAWWKTLLNNISFGLFFKEEQTASVTAQDLESGVKEVQVLVLSGNLPEKDSTEELIAWLNEQAGWTAFDGSESIRLEKNGTYVIYVKISDNVGNVTYISSDGIVIYSDTEAIDAAITYTKTGTDDVTANVKTSGNTIKEIKCGDTVLTPDAEYALSAEADNITAIIFKAAWLDSLEAGEYMLTITYDPQGVEYKDAEENDAPDTVTIALTVLLNSYRITFDSQGGSDVPSAEVPAGSPAAQPADPTRDGYLFGGWYKDAACTEAYDFSQPVTENLTLYAMWKANVENPATGDMGGTALWYLLVCLSGMCVFSLAVLKRRSRQKSETK